MTRTCLRQALALARWARDHGWQLAGSYFTSRPRSDGGTFWYRYTNYRRGDLLATLVADSVGPPRIEVYRLTATEPEDRWGEQIGMAAVSDIATGIRVLVALEILPVDWHRQPARIRQSPLFELVSA